MEIHKHNLILKYDTNIIWYGNTTQTLSDMEIRHIRLFFCRISISDYVCVVFPYQIMFVSYFNIRLCLCRISISDYVCVLSYHIIVVVSFLIILCLCRIFILDYDCVVFPYQIMFVSYFHLIWKYDTNIIWYGNTTQT
jgi:hypothetical protein